MVGVSTDHLPAPAFRWVHIPTEKNNKHKLKASPYRIIKLIMETTEQIAQWIVILFGVFFLFVGMLMLLKPKKARSVLRKAGSTNFINYAEITIRIIPAVALIIYAPLSKFPEVFKILGWFMLVTSFVFYFVPRKIHHSFSMKAADFLKPFYFQIISIFAFIFGGLIIYSSI